MGSDERIVVAATHTFRPEGESICICQPGTGVEILLTGLARHVWEVLAVTRTPSIAELTRSVGGRGGAGSEVGDVLRYLCDLRLVEITEGGEW